MYKCPKCGFKEKFYREAYYIKYFNSDERIERDPKFRNFKKIL